MDFSKLKLRSKPAQNNEDLTEFTYPEMVALSLHYTTIDRSFFFSAPKTTKRVKSMQRKYPKTAMARPMPMGALIAMTSALGERQKAHPLDVSPVADGRNFVTITKPEENAAAVYTTPKSVSTVVKAMRKGGYDTSKAGELKPVVVCHGGIASTGKTLDAQRRQRVAAVCQSLVTPGKHKRGLVASITASPAGFEQESLTGASTMLAVALSELEGKAQPNQLFDKMVKDPEVYEHVARIVGAGLENTVYEACVEDNHELVETSSAPTYQKLEDPIAAVMSLVPVMHPKTVGRVSANVLDGVAVDRHLRTRMNKLADIYVPPEAAIVYLDLSDRNLATQLLRREKGKKLVVFFKATQYQENKPLMKDHFSVETKDGVATTTLLKSGVIPFFGKFVSPIPEQTLYVNLAKTTAANVTSKTLVEGTTRVRGADAYKFEQKPNTKWFLISTHVYALNPALDEAGIAKPAYGPNFYVSRSFQTCNVLNANFEVPGITKFDAKGILDIFVHVLRCAMSYPITRVPCMTVESGGVTMQLIPAVMYYPFSGKEEAMAVIKTLQRGRNTVSVSSFGSNVVQTTEDEEVPPAEVPVQAERSQKKRVAVRKRPVPTTLLSTFGPAVDNDGDEDESEEDSYSD